MNPTIVEIGIAGGGSLEMWDYYFDGNCEIHGVDIKDRSELNLDVKNLTIWKGGQSDLDFWREFKCKVNNINIVIDDGSHRSSDQITSFNELYPLIEPNNGVYLCEDCHSSYDETKNCRSDSWVAYSKKIIDELYVKKLRSSIHFYEGVVVLEKSSKRLRSLKPRTN